MSEQKESTLSFIIKNIIIPIAIVFVLTKVVFVNAHVPTGSMENTIMINDYLIGSRLDKTYQRGDIIIFHSPDDPSIYLIKRVIGMPGETIEIKRGSDGYALVYADGNVLFEDYLKEPMAYEKDYHIEIPENAYFVMGDNRNNSYDARYWHTQTVDEQLIIGIAKFRYWPVTKAGILH